ncbi:MAG: MBL fold metallo-hydrolase [Candidatus Aminicenantia bacterium]
MERGLKVKFFGVRGSYPVASANFLKFGGNTSSVLVGTPHIYVIFDAGTGIVNIPSEIKSDSLPVMLLFTHLHLDHIIGYPFFISQIKHSTELYVAGPNFPSDFFKFMVDTFKSPIYPVSWGKIKSPKTIFALDGGESLIIYKGRVSLTKKGVEGNPDRKLIISSFKSNAHPEDGILIYSIKFNGKKIVYATDVEWKKTLDSKIKNFMRGCELLIHDAQYTPEEYSSKTNPTKGFGHSTYIKSCEVAREVEAKRLILFHHDPRHNDSTIEKIEKEARKIFPFTSSAYEGMEIRI